MRPSEFKLMRSNDQAVEQRPVAVAAALDDGRDNSVAPLVILLILICASVVGSFTYFTFSALDDLAASAMKERIEAALEVERMRLEDLNREYSFWDEAHQKLIAAEEVDATWPDSYIGGYLTKNYGIDLAVAVDPQRGPTAAYSGGVVVTPQRLSHISGLLQSRTETLGDSDGASAILTGYHRIDGKPYQVSIGRFVAEETEQPREDGSYLLLARELDASYIAHLVETYRLPPLRGVDRPSGSVDSQLELRDDSGRLVARLQWPIDKPGDALRSKLVPPGIAALSVLLVITWIIVQRDARYRKRHIEGLSQVASKDFLTGISNRREFFYLAGRELKRAQRESQPACLLLMDVDHFKQINDKHGHEVGDQVLIELAALVQENLREFDVFARWGGEEFIVLLPRADTHTGLDTAERLRLVIAAAGTNPDRIRYTVSVGVAAWDGSEGIDTLVSRADKALYRAKELGRNRTELALSPVAA